MVGMSKSGSRYGRRSNWFKIHCLIQDQAEMTNKLGEHGPGSGLLSLRGTMNGNSRHDEKRHYYDGKDSSSSTASPTGSASSPSDLGAPTLVGPSGKPYSLFDPPKLGSHHGSPYESSASPPYDRKDTIVFHPLPLSPVSPLHHNKFFFHHSPTGNGSKGLNGMSKLLHNHPYHPLTNGNLSDFTHHHPYSHHLSQAYSARYLSVVSPLMKPNVHGVPPEVSPVAVALDSCFPKPPEQEMAMDLTIGKKINSPGDTNGHSDVDSDDDDDYYVRSGRGKRGHDGEEGDDEGDDSEGPMEGETPVDTPLDLTSIKVTRDD